MTQLELPIDVERVLKAADEYTERVQPYYHSGSASTEKNNLMEAVTDYRRADALRQTR